MMTTEQDTALAAARSELCQTIGLSQAQFANPDIDGDMEPECWGETSYEHYKGVCRHFGGDE